MALIRVNGTYTGAKDTRGFNVVLIYDGYISDVDGTGSIAFRNTLYSTTNNFSSWSISSWIRINGSDLVSDTSQRTIAKNSSLILNSGTWYSPGYSGTNYPSLSVQSFADAVTDASYVPINNYAPGSPATISGFPTVNSAPADFSNIPYAAGTVGSSYSDYVQSLGATSISLISGSLPPGLSRDTGYGADSYAVTGTPTSSGTYSFTLQASNTGGTKNYSASIIIDPAPSAQVPDYSGTSYNTFSPFYWTGAGFTGSIYRDNSISNTLGAAYNGQYYSQSLSAYSYQPVNSSMVVYYYGTYVAPTYTVTYNGNGNTSGTAPIDSSSYTSGSSFTTKTQGTLLKTNYSFLGWNTNSSATTATYAASTTYTMSANNLVLYAIWAISTITPVFTDAALATPATLGASYSDGVVASNAVSYSIASGSLPPGLSLGTSTGTLTGTPTAQGNYTFAIRATSSTSTNTDTGNLIISVYPPGTRPSVSTRLTIAKRWNGTAWVDMTIMKRYDGTAWVNITNT